MNFQVLRGAIFTFVDGFEYRVSGLTATVNEVIIRFVETVLEAAEEITLTLFAAGYHFVTAVIEEGFNLFRASLMVVIGTPEEKEDLPSDIDRAEEVMAKAGEFHFEPLAGTEEEGN